MLQRNLDKRYLYTEAGNSFKGYRREGLECGSNLGDIRCCYFNIRPPLVDPLFHPFQGLSRNVFVRTDRDESEYSDRSIILSINLRTRDVEAIFRPFQNAFDYAAFFFERMGLQGEVDFEAKDEHC